MGIQASIQNITRPGGEPQVGDSFQVLIFTSEPNQSVYIEGGQVGKPTAVTPVGATDGQGRLILKNTWREGDIGQWNQQVFYNSARGKEFTPLNLTVSPRSATSTPSIPNNGEMQTIDNGGVLQAILPQGMNMQTLLMLAAAVGIGWFLSTRNSD